ncbi:MAG: hypothetical protein Q7K54_06125 [Candidatus Parcubacteria bacterium]|nr:hypothetical protein [Candidatus Parcubacteria bacterium]
MNSYNKTKIGKLFAFGGEHLVYEYDTDFVIKFSFLYFILGQKAREKAEKDYATCGKFFGKYILETEIAISPNKKHIVHIQPKIKGHFLVKKDLQKDIVRQQFIEIVDGYYSMTKAGNAEVDFIGRAGIFNRCLSNIFVTENNELFIIDATLLDVNTKGFLTPFVFLLRKFVVWRQNSTFKLFLS